MPEIIIRQPAEPTMIDDLTGKRKAKKYTVFGNQDGKEIRRYDTNYDYELLCSTNKSREQGGPEQIVTVEHYQNKHLRNRDGLVVIKKLYLKNIREFGWTPKTQFIVPQDVYREEVPPPGVQQKINGKKAKE